MWNMCSHLLHLLWTCVSHLFEVLLHLNMVLLHLFEVLSHLKHDVFVILKHFIFENHQPGTGMRSQIWGPKMLQNHTILCHFWASKIT